MNTKLLRAVVKYVEEEPRRFNMGTWYDDVSDAVKGDLEMLDPNEGRVGANQVEGPDQVLVTPSNLPPCGSVSCIAGTVCILTGDAERREQGDGKLVHYYSPAAGSWFSVAAKRLGLTEVQAERLFYPSEEFVDKMEGEKSHWPERFTKAYRKAKTPKGRASVLRARVEHFIRTKGAE